jgi:hypothetical protein
MSQARVSRSAIALLCALPLPAVAQEADFYGQFNLGVLNIDNGAVDETAFTDNDNSNSRVGAVFTQPLSNGGELRFHVETGLGFTGSSSINGADNSFEIDLRRTELRKFEVIYETAKAGTFYLGQGSISSDDKAEADFSGTTLAAYSGLSDVAASQEFQLVSGGGSGIDVGDTFNNFDGGRRFRIRYDTPQFAGFTLTASAGEEVLRSGDDNDYYDFGAKYDADYGAVTVAARLGYSIRDSDEELLLGSVAVLHEPSGFNVAVSSGRQEEGDASYFYVKAGLKRDWLAIGETRLSVDFYDGADFEVTGSESTSVGVALVQAVDALNLEIFALYRTFELEGAGAAVNDQDVTFVGARWRF